MGAEQNNDAKNIIWSLLALIKQKCSSLEGGLSLAGGALIFFAVLALILALAGDLVRGDGIWFIYLLCIVLLIFAGLEFVNGGRDNIDTPDAFIGTSESREDRFRAWVHDRFDPMEIKESHHEATDVDDYLSTKRRGFFKFCEDLFSDYDFICFVCRKSAVNKDSEFADSLIDMVESLSKPVLYILSTPSGYKELTLWKERHSRDHDLTKLYLADVSHTNYQDQSHIAYLLRQTADGLEIRWAFETNRTVDGFSHEYTLTVPEHDEYFLHVLYNSFEAAWKGIDGVQDTNQNEDQLAAKAFLKEIEVWGNESEYDVGENIEYLKNYRVPGDDLLDQ